MYPGGMRIGAEEEAAVLAVLRSKRLFRYYGPYAGKSKVAEFEREFAACVRTPHAVAVSSGTAALVCALAGLGVGPGDEVIVPAYTWISSAEAAIALGAVPIVAEIDESLTLDVGDVERIITARTKAIMPVHMRGAPCRMTEITTLAHRHGLKIVEDVAQAVGGIFAGRPLGSIGDAGAFSFQFNKIITCGEGGIAVAKDVDTYQRILMYHDVAAGQRNRFVDEEIMNGLNYRMSELHGAVMLVQLRRLPGLLTEMREHKAILKDAIKETAGRKGVSFRTINDPQGDTGTSFVFFAPTAERADAISVALNAEGAAATVIDRPGRPDYHVYAHWTPIMQQRVWSERGGPWRWHEGRVEYSPDMCPRSLELLRRSVHLDISPDMTSDNLEQLADALTKVFEGVL
jgi:8-amino-3,8-dideoxy-alpha-D-manno-octulosonate transaminase